MRPRTLLAVTLVLTGCHPLGQLAQQLGGASGVAGPITIADDTADTGDPGTPPTAPVTVCAASDGAPDWSATLLWAWDGVAADPAYRHLEISPVSGDLDGDGLTEIVAVALAEEGHDGSTFSGDGHGWLVILEGATGREILAVPDVYGMATRLVVHDLDGDGDDEVLAEVGGKLTALDLAGTLWTADACSTWNAPAAADLDGDGLVEVVNGSCGILDGATGQVRTPAWGASELDYTELVDVDGDGTLEIALGSQVRDASGAIVGALPPNTVRTLPMQGGAAPLSVAVGFFPRTSHFLDDALQVVGTVHHDYTDVPLICSGDVDHDGAPEAIVPSEFELALHELDGALVWSTEHRRFNGYQGAQACAVLDVDEDGCLDVFWPQNGEPRVYDAATGRLRTTFPADASASSTMEVPPIVDLDGDGSLELVVVGQDRDRGLVSWSGIRAYSEASGAWTGSAP